MKTNYLLIILLFSSVVLFAQEKKDIHIDNGELIETIKYHDNGMVSETGFYNKEGKLHGEWISYNTKGLKTVVANYNHGEKVDTWLFYHDNKIKEVTYANSKVSKVKTWESTNVEIVSNLK